MIYINGFYIKTDLNHKHNKYISKLLGIGDDSTIIQFNIIFYKLYKRDK